MSLRGVEARIGFELLHSGVGSTVPFQPLYEMAQKVDHVPLEKMLNHSRKMKDPFLSWECIRKFGVPLGNQRVTLSTGFEGYLVGQVNSAEEMIQDLAQTGVEIWRIALIRYKNQWKRKKQLREMITGESFSSWAAREWSVIFEAQLARRRASILKNKEAQAFRAENKKKVLGLSGVTYTVSDSGLITQKYELTSPRDQVVRPSLSHLSDEEMFGLLIMQEIGKFGHPLVRTALNSYRL